MTGGYLVIHYGGQAEVVEYLRAVAPHIHRAILPPTLIIKTINLKKVWRCVCAHVPEYGPRATLYLCDLTALVVPSNKSYSVRIPHLWTHKYTHTCISQSRSARAHAHTHTHTHTHTHLQS